MKNKQLFKTKTVAQQRQKRQTETAGEEKTVAVSGSLGPFSLLLQVSNTVNEIYRKSKLSRVIKNEATPMVKQT